MIALTVKQKMVIFLAFAGATVDRWPDPRELDPAWRRDMLFYAEGLQEKMGLTTKEMDTLQNDITDQEFMDALLAVMQEVMAAPETD